MQNIYRKWFEKSLRNGASVVINKWLGNYTTAYNTWKRIESITTLFQKSVSNKKADIRLLDVGCGDAIPLFMFDSLYNDIKRFKFYGIGIDISELNIAFAGRLKSVLKADNILFSVGDAKHLPFKEAFFDIVVCSEVLEHLEHPEVCLREIKRVLKDNGAALISTPNKNNAVVSLSKMFRSGRKETFNHNLISPESHNTYEHINVRGIREWKRTFLSVGFSISSIRRHGILYGGHRYNKHRLLFALTVVVDWMLDYLPFMHNLSEGVTFKLKKSGQDER